MNFPAALFVAHLSLLAIPSALYADNFSGHVVGVIDGDTIDVLHNGQAERIRPNGIDCPEKRQAFGKKAKQFTSSPPRSRKTDLAGYEEMSASTRISFIQKLPKGFPLCNGQR